MIDLTERLRIYAGQNYDSSVSFDAPELCHEAADEIERLRATLISSVGQGVSEILTERDALRARIEDAQIVKATHGGALRPEPRMTYIGKRVALVVLEDGE